MLKSELAVDSTYFTGLLWGWNYGMQRGDTAQAKAYLRNLVRIDGTNPIVQQFTLIDRNEDSLRRTIDPTRRSKFHLAIAQSFKAVDLPDEAIDEAQRSLRDNPGDVDAWLFQEQLFEQKNLPFAARWAHKQSLLAKPGDPTATAHDERKNIP